MNALNRKLQKLEDLHCLKSDLDMRRKLAESAAEEQTKKQLSSVSGIHDGELVERLFKAGFEADTLPALAAAPVALVAWGSGQVTREELTVAMQAIMDSEVAQQDAAVTKFQSWLETRPNPELFELWRDFVQAIPERLQSIDSDADRMLRWLNQVAASSGGVLGFGAICAGERSVIDRVRKVLQVSFDATPRERRSPLHEAA